MFAAVRRGCLDGGCHGFRVSGSRVSVSPRRGYSSGRHARLPGTDTVKIRIFVAGVRILPRIPLRKISIPHVQELSNL
jgi:hypothetical protein